MLKFVRIINNNNLDRTATTNNNNNAENIKIIIELTTNSKNLFSINTKINN